MNNINKIYSMSPPGLMRPDSDDMSVDNTTAAPEEARPEPMRSCIDEMPLGNGIRTETEVAEYI